MTAITFDTLAYSNALQKAGISREQAEAMARANADALESIVKSQELATKADLRETELRIELKMQKMENHIRNWVIGSMLVLVSIFIGGATLIVSYLPK